MGEDYNQENSDSSMKTTISVKENHKIQIEPNPKEMIQSNDSIIKQPTTTTTTTENETSSKKKTFFRVMTFIALQVSLFLGALDR